MILLIISIVVLIAAFAIPAAASVRFGVDSRRDPHLNW